MPELWDDLLDCLALCPQGTGTGDADGATTVFLGRNQLLSYHRLFGGQLLGQFVQAAGLTCPGKVVKSLHALFPRAGTTDEAVRYEVQRQHEGTSFASVTIAARQATHVIATAAVCLHAAEEGPDRQSVPDPPPLPTAEHRVVLGLLPWETRSTTDLDSTASGPPEFELWMRTPPAAKDLAPALLAYATDLTLIGTALRPVDGLSQRDAGTAFTSAVTSHSVWFHRPFRTDDWLLLRQHSPVLANGRCFGRGDVLTERGALVASFAQEALLRFQPLTHSEV